MEPPDFSVHPVVLLLDELLAVPSPPGREQRMAEFLRGKVEHIGFPTEIDPAGNLVVRVNPDAAGRPVIMAAHMDEIALVVSRIEKDGRLRVAPSGGMAPHKLGERMVDILGDREILKGVVSSGTGHIGAKATPFTWKDYWIMTGLSVGQLREKGVHPGSAMVPAREGRGPLVFGDPADPMIAAWTFDDRMGVIALLRLLERLKADPARFEKPLIIAFTVHEEGGAHGAKSLNHRERPELFIGVDGCPLQLETGLELDARPVIWAKDAKTNYDHGAIVAFDEAARACGVQLQRVVLENAYSDASASYDTGGAPRVALFGHVRENSHGFEVARLAIFDNVLKVLEAFVRSSPLMKSGKG